MNKKKKLKHRLKLADEVLDYLETEEGQELLRLAGGFVSFIEPKTETVMWAAACASYWSPRDEDVAVFHSHVAGVVEDEIEALNKKGKP
jgi:hypothetical protein